MPRVRIHTNPFHFYKKIPVANPANLFADFHGKLDLEIGVGQGAFLKAYAEANPQKSIIGVEIRKPWIEKVLIDLENANLKNVLLLYAKAELILENFMPEKIIENVFIFHPDPWFKTKHYKRRLINLSFLQDLKPKLSSNAKIYVTTDVFDLFQDIKNVFKNDSDFKVIQDDLFWQKYYQTHWQVATQNLGRNEHLIVYEYCK